MSDDFIASLWCWSFTLFLVEIPFLSPFKPIELLHLLLLSPRCASNPLLFIGFPLCHPCFLFLKQSLNLCEAFFMFITISLLLAFLWIFHILIWILDEKIMSFFLHLALHIHSHFFLCFFSTFENRLQLYILHHWLQNLNLWPFIHKACSLTNVKVFVVTNKVDFTILMDFVW